jgi:hypothetical protein
MNAYAPFWPVIAFEAGTIIAVVGSLFLFIHILGRLQRLEEKNGIAKTR